ncbi:hypothetical protein F0225_17960 [Vibrio pectenicida]|uniref:Chloramphenicol phosphotransferase n=1 Tax=Vibrio pectenicida TaxID=62763 RepID=A0A7Y4EFW2_9VIBR|nr:hypothetical protein [Vibrio pectenicida]NOH73204.1 hypothetical protein [Vibrio pectenicida]
MQLKSGSHLTRLERLLSIQALLPDNYLHLGIDTFIEMMPERTNNLANPDVPSDGFYWQTQTGEEQSSLRIKSGEYGVQVNHAYHSTVKHLANLGLKVIVDDIMNGANEQQSWLAVLDGTESLFVAVVCSDAELRNRENLRKDRVSGTAIEQNHRVHNGVSYDFEINTTDCSPKKCAQEIASHIENALK